MCRRESEEYLYTHPDIIDVQVVGVPDDKYGEEICAFVQVRSGASLDVEQIRRFCEERIAHYKIPRHVIGIESFPMTVTGKVQKYKLRELAVKMLGSDATATPAE